MLVEYYYPWDSPGKNTGVGCHFPTPGDLPNPGIKLASPGSSAFAGDLGLIPGSERIPGEGNGNSLQYLCLGNSMERGAWHKTQIPLSDQDFHFSFTWDAL